MAGDIGENLERQFHVRSFPVYEVTKYGKILFLVLFSSLDVSLNYKSYKIRMISPTVCDPAV